MQWDGLDSLGRERCRLCFKQWNHSVERMRNKREMGLSEGDDEGREGKGERGGRERGREAWKEGGQVEGREGEGKE